MSLIQPSIPTRQVPKWVQHEGTRFRAVAFEILVRASLEEVWNELSNNYVGVQDVHAAVKSSYGIAGSPQVGPGAVRHCDLDFKGKHVAIRERIIDFIEEPLHREYTYDVYESQGFPAKVFNTWYARAEKDNQSTLGNVFYFRMRPAFMTYFMAGQIRAAARSSVLGFKHFFETGERNVPGKQILELYPMAA